MAAIATSFLVSVLFSFLLVNSSHRLNALDHPGERSLHDQPVPRTGGLAILLALLSGLAVAFFGAGWTATLSGLTAAVLLLALVSFIDDHINLSALLRLPVHFLVAGLVLAALPLPALQLSPLPAANLPPGLLVGILLMLLVWMINLYNFMDGMDGFAGGMGIIGFTTLALLGWNAGFPIYMMMNLVIVSAIAGFVLFNFPPARIFMGDTGSSLLGLLAGSMIVYGAALNAFPLWVGLLVFSVFMVDATLTLLKRLFRGQAVWRAHREHYYQRLVQSGWGHRKTVLWSYLLMLLCGIGGWFAAGADTAQQWGVYLISIVTYVILIVSLSVYLKRGESVGE